MAMTCSWTQAFYQLLQYGFGQNQRPLCIYGDPSYPLRVNLQAGFKEAQLSQQQLIGVFK